jgi:microsomal dipeptidase-like Zn-dependent dipeptidase
VHRLTAIKQALPFNQHSSRFGAVFADLHAHYPMRVVAGMDPDTASRLMRSGKQPTWRDRIQARILRFANRIGNFPSWDGTYRIDPKKLADGKVGLAMSVLFRPFDEMDLGKRYAAAPDPEYFGRLMADLHAVETEVEGHGPGTIRIAHDLTELDAAIDAGVPALVHAVEGGFHLGDSETEIEDNCAALDACGVGYVTVAHLFFRQVATNANAIPFVPDPLYALVFPQRGRDRLTPRGEALVGSLVDKRILVDLSHMDPPAIAETLTYMDAIDGDRTMPVISTHAGYRFGRQRYMHDAKTLRKIADRNGVVGLIMAQHQLNDGLPEEGTETKTIEESMAVLRRHVDAIKAATGSYDHIALGTDLDGFIKPTIGGIEDISDLPALEAPLVAAYGQEVAEKIMWKNALRVLRQAWS